MRNQKGFTIVELIVVIAIIAVLAAMVMVKVLDYEAKSKNSAIRANLYSLSTKGVQFFESNSNYNDFCSSELGAKFVETAIEGPGILSSFACSCDTLDCINPATQWCACAELARASDTAEGSVFCIDSRGVKEQTPATDCATQCPALTGVCQ